MLRRGASGWLWLRVSATVIGFAAIVIFAVVAWLYFSQHSMIYHPRPYIGAYAHAFQPNGWQLDYTLPFGTQSAYYIPNGPAEPRRVWVAFCGNGSLALDWLSILKGYPPNGDGFLLVDYPGYGRNSGYASVQSTRATAEAALKALGTRLNREPDRLRLAVIGHSLGAAAALDFAAHHPVERAVLIAPFTTLREEAARVVGGPLSRILVDNYDNRDNLRTVLARNPGVQIAIFHGTDDDVIPVRMGRELKEQFSSVEFVPVQGADHVSVLDWARNDIISYMTR